MSIPIKINPLGINSSIYISSPLIGKGTQSDPISLSFNPVYFSVDNDTNQFNINTINIPLKSDLNKYLPLSGGIITGETSIANNLIIEKDNIIANCTVSVDAAFYCQHIINAKTYFRKTSTILNKETIYEQNTYDNDLIFADSENKTIFRMDTCLGPSSYICGRLLIQNKTNTNEAELALKYDINNYPKITWSYPTTGENTELTRCDWIKNNYLSLSGGTINRYFNIKSDKILYNQYAGDTSTYLNLSFLDANNVGIGRCEYVDENIRKCTRIATTNPNSSGEYIELSVGYDENGIARTWLNRPCNGNDGEVARCDWVKGTLTLDLSTPLEADTTGNLWYKEFPDGFIIQGGTTLVTSTGTIATYLKPMSTCYGATAIIEGITDASKNVIIKTKNNISIELIQSDTEILTVNWIVFGKE